MIYSYYNLEENLHKDEDVKEEIENLLEQIELEKKIVKANMITEKTQMDPKDREREGRAINNLVFSEKRGRRYSTGLKFTRKEKIRTEIKKGDLCVLTINDEEINCEIGNITSNSVIVYTDEKNS